MRHQQNSASFFLVGIDNPIMKFKWKYKEARIVRTILGKIEENLQYLISRFS